MEQTERVLDVDQLSDKILVNINKALYNNGAGSIRLYGRKYPIQRHRKGMRYVEIGDVIFMQQNRYKGTHYARMVAEGHKITWGMRKGQWIKIIDDEVQR